MKGKSSINLTSLVEFEHHSMADTIRNENEEKKIKVKAPVTAKKNKQHQTSNCDISVTSAAAELKFLLCAAALVTERERIQFIVMSNIKQ